MQAGIIKNKTINRQPTAQEKKVKRDELIRGLLTLEKRQKQIFGKAVFKPRTLEAFEEELKNRTKKQLKT